VYLLLAVLAGLGNAGVGLWGATAQRRGCRPGAVALLFLSTVALVSLLILPAVSRAGATPGLWGLAACMGALYVAAIRTSVVANGRCPPSLVWSLANLAMVVPIGLAPLIFAERWQPIDALIAAAFAGLLYAFHRGTNQAGERPASGWSRVLPLLAVVFLSNGLLMLGYKLKAAYWPEAGAVPFAAMVFGCGSLLELALQWLPQRRLELRPEEWRYGIAVGLAAAVANIALVGAAPLPAVILFPIVQGLSLSGGALLIIVCLHEGVNRWKVLGFAMAGVVMAAAVLR